MQQIYEHDPVIGTIVFIGGDGVRVRKRSTGGGG